MLKSIYTIISTTDPKFYYFIGSTLTTLCSKVEISIVEFSISNV